MDDRQGVLQYARELVGVIDGDGPRAAGRGRHAGQVHLGFERGVEVVRRRGGTGRVHLQRGLLRGPPAAVVVDHRQGRRAVPARDPLRRRRHPEQVAAVSHEAYHRTFWSRELRTYGAAACPSQGTAASADQ